MGLAAVERADEKPTLLAVMRAVVLSVVLGGTTFAVWTVAGRQAFQGGIAHVISDRGLLIYGLLALGSALIGYLMTRGPLRQSSARRVVIETVAAWLFEGVIVLVFGSFLANELRTLEFRAAVWLTATGVVLQPLAVLVGSWLAVKTAADRESGRARTRPDQSRANESGR